MPSSFLNGPVIVPTRSPIMSSTLPNMDFTPSMMPWTMLRPASFNHSPASAKISRILSGKFAKKSMAWSSFSLIVSFSQLNLSEIQLMTGSIFS